MVSTALYTRDGLNHYCSTMFYYILVSVRKIEKVREDMSKSPLRPRSPSTGMCWLMGQVDRYLISITTTVHCLWEKSASNLWEAVAVMHGYQTSLTSCLSLTSEGVGFRDRDLHGEWVSLNACEKGAWEHGLNWPLSNIAKIKNRWTHRKFARTPIFMRAPTDSDMTEPEGPLSPCCVHWSDTCIWRELVVKRKHVSND